MRDLARELDKARLGTWMAPQVSFAAGEDVVRQGEEGDQAYVVESGSLEVLQEGVGRIRVLGPGEVFGEMAPLTRSRRTSTVRALTDSVLAVIDGAQLRESLDMGNLGGRFVAALAHRLIDREQSSQDITPADDGFLKL
jgi:CRP-like cAMP-binding protein